MTGSAANKNALGASDLVSSGNLTFLKERFEKKSNLNQLRKEKPGSIYSMLESEVPYTKIPPMDGSVFQYGGQQQLL